MRIPLVSTQNPPRCKLPAFIKRGDKAILHAWFIVDTGCPYSVILSAIEAQKSRFFQIEGKPSDMVTYGIGGGNTPLYKVENITLSVCDENNKEIVLDTSNFYVSGCSTFRQGATVFKDQNSMSIIGLDFIIHNNLRFVFDKDQAYLEIL